MSQIDFNPYEAPAATLPTKAKASRRHLSFGEVVIVAWIFSILVAIEVPLSHTSWRPADLDLIINPQETALILLAVTVAPVLTILYVARRAVEAIGRRARERTR